NRLANLLHGLYLFERNNLSLASSRIIVSPRRPAERLLRIPTKEFSDSLDPGPLFYPASSHSLNRRLLPFAGAPPPRQLKRLRRLPLPHQPRPMCIQQIPPRHHPHQFPRP